MFLDGEKTGYTLTMNSKKVLLSISGVSILVISCIGLCTSLFGDKIRGAVADNPINTLLIDHTQKFPAYSGKDVSFTTSTGSNDFNLAIGNVTFDPGTKFCENNKYAECPASVNGFRLYVGLNNIKSISIDYVASGNEEHAIVLTDSAGETLYESTQVVTFNYLGGVPATGIEVYFSGYDSLSFTSLKAAYACVPD